MDAFDEVEQVIDALYVPPPAGFTAARDAAAARLKAAGDKAAAKRVAALRRPTLAAWASNTLVRAQPEEAEQFLQLGRALREAHRDLDGEQLRNLSHEQHVVIGALAREAVRLAEEAGTPVSEAVEREVEQILHAVLADPGAAEGWASGRLAKAPAAVTEFPVAAPDAVARTAEARPEAGPEAEPVPDPDAERREAERAAAAREEELRTAEEARQRALERVAEADAEVERLERDAARARAARDQAHADLAAAEKRRRAAHRH
ncbi:MULTISPECIES: hypothetical protein [unclassified Streptomyces]|uniref:hypothetical protein n=1 Tax=unclassified Streptomyces TaxID=2593676 RepID=UPI00109E6D61|nr:hypothetical protein [Streptomyces sp. A1136]THA52958.1 hypothetical protein E6R62_20105 [Streptomyces sp. A1136]